MNIATTAYRRAKGLLKISELLANAHTKKRVADIIINEGFSILQAKSGDISLLMGNGYEVIAQKGYAEDFIDKHFPLSPDTPLVTNIVLQTKKPYYIKHVDELDNKYQVAKSFILTSGATSAVLMPLKVRKKLIGIMQFTFRDPQAFSRVDKIFMSTLANHCAQAFERVIAQEELIESKEELEAILKNVADGIVVQNIEGKILYTNDAGAQLFNFASAKRVEGKQFSTIISPFNVYTEKDKKVQLPELLKSQVHAQNSFAQFLLKFIHKKTNHIRWISIKVTGLFDKSGNLTLLITTLEDTTSNKELDQKKDEFISMASHELKTPLTSTKLFVDLLMKRADEVQDVVSSGYLNRLKEQLGRFERLISDLLDVSRIRTGKFQFHPEKFLLNEVIMNTVSEVQTIFPSHKIIFQNISSFIIDGDKFRIYQVIANLITNACKYSAPGKKVIVSLKQNKNDVIVSVKDFGIGIADKNKEKIFDRFYQVADTKEKKYAGLGMGLYITREVVQSHGGKIWIQSIYGKGTTFYFSLPVVKK